MKSRLNLRTLTVLALTAFAAFALSVQASPASHHKVKGTVYWLNLAGGSSVAPKRVYYTANSGGYMKKIRWKHWGARKTVGRGRFGTTAPCNGPCHPGPARMVLRKPVTCHPAFGDKEGKKIKVYRKGTLYYPDPYTGKRRATSLTYRTGWGACKESF